MITLTVTSVLRTFNPCQTGQQLAAPSAWPGGQIPVPTAGRYSWSASPVGARPAGPQILQEVIRLSLQLYTSEPERVGNHTDTGEGHCARREHGIELLQETWCVRYKHQYTGGNRD